MEDGTVPLLVTAWNYAQKVGEGGGGWRVKSEWGRWRHWVRNSSELFRERGVKAEGYSWRRST